MTVLNRSLILCWCMLSVLILNGQNSYLNKKVNLSTGQVQLKTALNSISNQTGCVFSYDPTKIQDKQIITISSKGSQPLRSTLTEILPNNIVFKLNGKYIVLQETNNKSDKKSKTTSLKLPIQNKSTNLKVTCKGKIDKDPNVERLVLPPLPGNSETSFITPKVDISQIQPVDSATVKENTIPIQQKDSNLIDSVVFEKNSNNQVLAKESTSTDSLFVNPDKADTLKTNHSGFYNFIKKNGYLETGVSLNKQLGALAIHGGLNNFYAILSIGSDYNQTYLLGLGVGASITLNNHFSLNFDLLRNSIIAGKSFALNVKASNTQVIPLLNYSLSSFKIFAGPTLNLIKSSYVSTITTTDLGVLVGLGFSIGIKVDLKKLLSK